MSSSFAADTLKNKIWLSSGTWSDSSQIVYWGSTYFLFHCAYSGYIIILTTVANNPKNSFFNYLSCNFAIWRHITFNLSFGLFSLYLSSFMNWLPHMDHPMAFDMLNKLASSITNGVWSFKCFNVTPFSLF